jgi:hypothetical protein
MTSTHPLHAATVVVRTETGQTVASLPTEQVLDRRLTAVEHTR